MNGSSHFEPMTPAELDGLCDAVRVTASYEVDGMQAVHAAAEPWVSRLEPPHPPQVARAAGALITVASSLRHAYVLAYTLLDAGLLVSATSATPTETREDDVEQLAQAMYSEPLPSPLDVDQSEWPWELCHGPTKDAFRTYARVALGRLADAVAAGSRTPKCSCDSGADRECAGDGDGGSAGR